MDTSPEEARKVWEGMQKPTIRGVHRALKAAGRTVSLTTLQIWFKNGWTRGETGAGVPPEHKIERTVPVVTGDPSLGLQGYLNTDIERRAELEQLSLPEFENVRIRTSDILEIRIEEDLHELGRELLKKDLTGVSNLLKALAA